VREILLIIIVLAIAAIALVRPYVGILGYFWFALMRPDVLAWSYGRHPYSMVLAVATVLGAIRYLHQAGIVFRNPFTRALLLYQIPVLISVVTALKIEQCYYNLDIFERMMLMSFLVVLLVRTVAQLRVLLMVAGFSAIVLGAKFGLFGLLAGGVRFGAGYGGMISDNNDLALFMSMGIALTWFFIPELKSRWLRLGAVGLVFCNLAAIVMTYSRGGALTLAAVLGVIVLRSKQRLAMVLVFVVLAAPGVILVGDTYTSRLKTISNPEYEASSYSRIALAKASLQMWKDYPIFGVGFGGGNCALIVGRYTDAKEKAVLHNTYLQILVDSGIFALLMYVAILFGTIVWLGLSARRLRRTDPALARIPIAIQTALIAFAVGSTFLSRVNADFTYLLICAAASWYEILRVRARSAPAPASVPQETPVPADAIHAHAL
jgi:putative inorganic carbon (hco3(-)) transporter